MSDPQPQSAPEHTNGKFKWALVVLIMGVLVLASLALGHSDVEQIPTFSPTGTEVAGTASAGSALTETVTPEFPPTPDEIGYTDGIIFFATILVLILLVGTLREVVHRKGV